jgi:hypothetical protein
MDRSSQYSTVGDRSAGGALRWLDGEAVGVDAVVVDEVVRTRLDELVRLVHGELLHLLLLPPVSALLAVRAPATRLAGVPVAGVGGPGAAVHAHVPEREDGRHRRSGHDPRGKGTRTKNNPTKEQIDDYI